MAKKKIIQKILEAGLKKTDNRINIIEILEKTNQLLSAQDIYDQLNLGDRRVNLSTIYRTLDVLAENKIINRVSMSNEKQALYEYNHQTHHHFIVCKECNKIVSLYDCPLHAYEKELQENTGFLITGHRIEFYGYCKDCQEKMNHA